jgi:glycosyltransferase involved in cell wall biosynthesis
MNTPREDDQRPIAFDATVLAAGPPTGVARSFVDTLDALARTTSRRRPLVVLAPRDEDLCDASRQELAELDPTIERVRLPVGTGRGLRRIAAIARACDRVDAALLHAPVALVPPRGAWRRVLGARTGRTQALVATVHDLPWRACERLDEPGCRWPARLAARLAVRSADVVLVPSRHTRDDLLAETERGPRRARIVVCGHGIRPRWPGANDLERPGHRAAEAARPAPGQAPFFLVLGDDRPRKNRDRLERAWRLAQARCADLPPLRFVGPPDAHVDESTKWRLLRSARALVHVSLHEGFGLTVVEAFRARVPVLCSGTASLPEVVGGAALMVDPRSVGAIAAGLERIHRDETLRSDLVRRGALRSLRWTCESAAATWRSVHDSLLQERGA